MEQLADAIADGMNKVNEDANKNRKKGGQTFMTKLILNGKRWKEMKIKPIRITNNLWD